MKYHYIYIVVGLLFLSCNSKEHKNSFYIGGEIINPQSNFVLLMQQDYIIDSLFLDEKNTFGKIITDSKPGLYYFKHGYEFQYLYLEPEDSIRLRLNTWDFDETLVFEGKGSVKNELLLELFLENEKVRSNFYSYFALTEIEFTKKINNVFKRQNALLQKLITTENEISDKYIYIAKAAINFPIYSIKELYPYYHKKANKSKELINLTTDFYSFRNKIDYNDSSLFEFHSYQNYLTTYYYNIALYKNKGNLNNNLFYHILFDLINNKTTNASFKNRLLIKEIENLFVNKPHLIDDSLMQSFYSFCSDTIANNSIKETLLLKEKLQLNTKFPNFKILNNLGKTKNINAVITNKNSVVYFWSSKHLSHIYHKNRLNYLNENFPDITFIGINTDRINKNYFLNSNINQFSLPEMSIGRKFISEKYPRAILINSKGNVTASFNVLTSYRIEKNLDFLKNH